MEQTPPFPTGGVGGTHPESSGFGGPVASGSGAGTQARDQEETPQAQAPVPAKKVRIPSVLATWYQLKSERGIYTVNSTS